MTLQILCKDNTALGLRDYLTQLLEKGAVDIVILFLVAQQLQLLRSTDSSRGPVRGRSIETITSMPSHRQATRPEDDIAIWSLLHWIGSGAHYTAENLWRA
jgi:hypothetical protein